jgi:hypothetical protein
MLKRVGDPPPPEYLRIGDKAAVQTTHGRLVPSRQRSDVLAWRRLVAACFPRMIALLRTAPLSSRSEWRRTSSLARNQAAAGGVPTRK